MFYGYTPYDLLCTLSFQENYQQVSFRNKPHNYQVYFPFRFLVDEMLYEEDMFS